MQLVQHGQDLSLDSTYFEQVLEEHLLTTNYLNSFFPLHLTNISPSQTQRVILYTVFEMYTSFSRSWLQGGQHTCRYSEVAKEKKKIMQQQRTEAWLFWCVGFFSVPTKIQLCGGFVCKVILCPPSLSFHFTPTSSALVILNSHDSWWNASFAK